MLNETQLWAIFDGSLVTLKIALVAIIFGAVFGVIVALGRISKNKVTNGLSWFYVWFFRGTPLLLQLFIIFYAVPIIYLDITGLTFEIDPMICAYITFSLNSTAYLAEMIRAAIESIDHGQMEAAKALGMSYRQAMTRIIIPQTYKRLVAPVGNELIMLLKDTSLVSTIALFDVLRTVKTMASSTGNWVYYVYAAVIYLFLTTILQVIFDKIEKKLGVYEKR
ncbi:MAG: amino acid ABC transporter permease [Eubacterium aggregans]|uniref:Amino acid ABC transporter membrane protein, PAAT family n=1 Tax=Eubacterium aggregans TaxID=81409 RepID=A0A1H4DAU8_9FIRM|nr:amino acid ABC transporter permease [Eubacterium aggregans]MDD4690842.1 amino acid ABC transporter permease [Eubacterium aggregans]MEA5074380.1 amino acid ABC transporter permease [Eubacterium aggregans]SEA69549.1 amino acid ABC transporter membrane protein, PAAT family [Eubacterium aggregans]